MLIAYVKYISFVVVAFILIVCTSFQAAAQVDSTGIVADPFPRINYGPSRTTSIEFILGYTHGWASGDKIVVANNGNEFRSGTISAPSPGVQLGFGAHLPLFRTGPQTTAWLVPSIIGGAFFEEFRKKILDSRNRISSTTICLDVQLHATYGYGAMRRKGSQFGIEGGIGATFRYGGHGAENPYNDASGSDVARFVPTMLIDLAYVPGSVYRIRFTSDLFESKMSYGIIARQMSVSFVFGS